MTTPQRCRHLWNSSLKVLYGGVPGAFVECGVWKGGSSAVMGLALKRARENRLLHLFDSFEGLPEPRDVDGTAAGAYTKGRVSGILSSTGMCQAGLEEVKNVLFERIGLAEGQIRFHVGWFQRTVPAHANTIGRIAVLRLDGDWYDSTKTCLEYLYPLLSPGGILILDDYFCWEGCRKATDEYRAANQISTPIERIDLAAGCWWKPIA